jgi:hypothetical protein
MKTFGAAWRACVLCQSSSDLWGSDQHNFAWPPSKRKHCMRILLRVSIDAPEDKILHARKIRIIDLWSQTRALSLLQLVVHAEQKI